MLGTEIRRVAVFCHGLSVSDTETFFQRIQRMERFTNVDRIMRRLRVKSDLFVSSASRDAVHNL